MMRVSTYKNLVFFLSALCLGGAAFFISPPYGMDDCYITYRYAYNLYHHQEFVFNPGERILGTTSPLYTLILTVAQLVSGNIPLMSNLISCISAALAGFLLLLIFKKDNLPLGIFCSVSYPFMLQDIGLETNVLMFLFTGALYLFARANYLGCGAVRVDRRERILRGAWDEWGRPKKPAVVQGDAQNGFLCHRDELADAVLAQNL